MSIAEEWKMPNSWRSRKSIQLKVFAVLSITLATCGFGAEPTSAPVADGLGVKDVFFSPPVPFNGWVMITVTGTLPDGCTKIEEMRHDRVEDGYGLNIETSRPDGVACAQVATPFRKSIRVETGSLGPGTYRVYLRGATYTFTFDEGFEVPLTPDQGS
jgi:hypothetical protein